MSASYFDLLKYAATGIASPDMSYYDKLRASTLMGGAVQTLTGQPPLTFKADGTPLISLSMLGNGQQTGTPTHDNPVMPTFCGVRTGNLFDADTYYGNYKSGDSYTATTSQFNATVLTPFTASDIGKTYTIRCEITDISSRNVRWIANIGGVNVNGDGRSNVGGIELTFTVETASDSLKLTYGSISASLTISSIMLNSGSTALPYEPYGWAEKITCAGQTVPVYLGQVSTVRRIKKLVFDGTESWNRSTQGNNTRIYAPQIAECMSLSPAICTHFNYNVTNVGYPKIGEFVINSSRAIIFGVDGNTFVDVGTWKSYLASEYAAGTPVTVWYVLATPTTGIVNEPLCKIGTYADELSSTDAGVTIQTTKGQNTLTVDTPIQPSEMTITYKG